MYFCRHPTDDNIRVVNSKLRPIPLGSGWLGAPNERIGRRNTNSLTFIIGWHSQSFILTNRFVYTSPSRDGAKKVRLIVGCYENGWRRQNYVWPPPVTLDHHLVNLTLAILEWSEFPHKINPFNFAVSKPSKWNEHLFLILRFRTLLATGQPK